MQNLLPKNWMEMAENTHTSDPKAKNSLQLTIGTYLKNIDSNHRDFDAKTKRNQST